MSSNMIKGYQISYDKQTFKKVEFKDKEEALIEKVERLYAEQQKKPKAGGFVAGLIAEDISDQVEGLEGFESGEGYSEQQEQSYGMTEEELEAYKEQVRAEVIEQITAEISENLQAQMTDQINEAMANVQAQAEALRQEAREAGRQEGEAAKAGIIQLASSQGYEDGLKRAQAEQQEAIESINRQRLELEKEYENQVQSIEPDFVKILKEYVKKVCGVTYKYHDEVFKYLLDSGFHGNSKEDGFTIFMSQTDFNRFNSQFDKIIADYADKFALTFSINDDLCEGDITLENEHKIINCGTGVNLTGLFEALDMMALVGQQE